MQKLAKKLVLDLKKQLLKFFKKDKIKVINFEDKDDLKYKVK